MPRCAIFRATVVCAAATACCQSIKWHDSAAMRAAKSNSRARIFPESEPGFARARVSRCFSIALNAA